MTFLGRVRRRKAVITRAVLPLLVVVWGNALASPCLGMRVEALDQSASEISNHAHGHMPAHGAHSHHVDGTNDERASSEQQPSCPHCPHGSHHEDAGAHIACSALDDFADASGQHGIAKLQLAQVVPIATTVALAEIPRILSPIPARTAPPVVPAVALHLRHCVFLI